MELTDADIKENIGFATLWYLLDNRSVVKTMEELESRGVKKSRNQLSRILHSLKVQINTSTEVHSAITDALSDDDERLKALDEWLTVGFRKKSNVTKEPLDVTESLLLKEPSRLSEPLQIKEPNSRNEPDQLIDSHGINESLNIIEPSCTTEPHGLIESNQLNESILPIESSSSNEPAEPIDPNTKNEPCLLIEPNENNGVFLMDLTINTCKFPLWNHNEYPKVNSSMYCGNHISDTRGSLVLSSYCDKHRVIVEDPRPRKGKVKA